MIYINQENPIKVTENSSLADRIRGNRPTFQCTEEMAKRTQDVFEKSGCKKVTYPQYTKFAVIDTPAANIRSEMREVMTGYYDGEISKDEIKGFFMEYCSTMYARDEKTILNVYETFLNVNYTEAVNACFDKGKTIAAEEGTTTDGMTYYDAEYYYRSEEIHKALQEAAKEYGEKYGVEIDASRRDENFNGDYLTGKPNFNDKWNFMAANIYGVGRIMDMDAIPPESFSFFYHLGEEDMGAKDSLLIVRGKDWTERLNVPFEVPTAGRKRTDYFYLADLCRISSEKEENYKQYNDFLNKLVINRVAPGIIIKRR
ncbi:MAG: hypothetical protein NC433_04450 [Clostridiales bacterium]|nr:hypothetical protein [Clostridiales bacterium]